MTDTARAYVEAVSEQYRFFCDWLVAAEPSIRKAIIRKECGELYGAEPHHSVCDRFSEELKSRIDRELGWWRYTKLVSFYDRRAMHTYVRVRIGDAAYRIDGAYQQFVPEDLRVGLPTIMCEPDACGDAVYDLMSKYRIPTEYGRLLGAEWHEAW